MPHPFVSADYTAEYKHHQARLKLPRGVLSTNGNDYPSSNKHGFQHQNAYAPRQGTVNRPHNTFHLGIFTADLCHDSSRDSSIFVFYS